MIKIVQKKLQRIRAVENTLRVMVIVTLLFYALMLAGCRKETEVFIKEYEDSGLDEAQTAVTEEPYNNGNPLDTELITQTETEVLMYYVYVCGAVAKPGVYMLPQGSRVYEALELAGGLTEDADDTYINQAEPVSDGQMIRVYTCEEVQDKDLGLTDKTDGISDDEHSIDNRININTAGKNELMTLPGIGSAKAEAILAYRQEYGGFSKVEELMNIPGIKSGVFVQIKELIKVNETK